MKSKTPTRKRVLAVASGGGHWEQLLQLRGALADYDTRFVTTLAGLAEQSGIDGAYVVPDVNRNHLVPSIMCALKLFWLCVWLRPTAVISTGAAPGLIALAIGKVLFRKTIWLDSIANAEELSMCGKLAKHFADVWLTQWPHLETTSGPEYAGSVM